MPIQPAASGPSNPSDRLSGKSQVERSARPAPQDPGAGAAGDRIELSEAARGLVEESLSIPIGEVPSDRLREFSRRLLDGHYERPEVRDEVLRRILSGL